MKKFTKFGFRHLMSCLLILFAFGMHAQEQQQWPAVIMGPEKACPNDSLHYMLYVDLNLGCIEEYDTEWFVDGLEGGYRVGSGGGESSAYIDLVWLVSGDYTVTCKGTIYASTESIPFDVSFDVTVQETGVLTLADESGALEQSVCADAEIEPIIFDATNASPDYLVTDGDFSGLTIEWINNDTQLSITGTPEYPLTFTVATGNENCPNGPAQTITIDIIKYDITASVEGTGGTITSITPATVDCGGTSTIIFDPADCQEIKTVKDNNEDVTALVTNNTYVINDIQEDHNVIVTFDTIEYTITATVVGEGGTINPSGEVVVNCGNDKMFTFTPDECYQIKEVKVDGVVIPTANSYTFEDVAANHTISVAFELVPYTITATVVGGVGGTATVDPATVDCGGTSTVTFEMEDCYEIKNVTDNGEDVTALVENNKYVIDTIKANHAVVVTFGLIEYTITATVVGEGGTIDPIGEVIVDCGTNKTFNFTPAACNQIKEVKVDGVVIPTANSYTFNNVTEDHTISVAFELIPYTITATVVGEGGTIDPIGEVIVDCGTNKTFNFTPAACNQIKEVKVDGVVIPTANSYTFNNVTANHTISVEFELIPYTITATVVGEGGTIDPIGEVIVDCGTNKTFNFTPAACNQIKEVKVDGVVIPTANSYTFNNVTEDHTISVEFELIPYTITATVVGEGGTIDPIGEVIVDCGTNKTFNFTPAACNQIKEVKVDGVVIPTANSYTFNNVTANHTISVEFELIPYTITATVVGEGGTIDPIGEVIVDCGTNKTFNFTPAACNQIKEVKVDGVVIPTANSYTFNNVTEDHTISVEFELIPYTITATVVGEGGTIDPIGEVIVDCGTNKTFNFTPAACNQIKEVKVDGVVIPTANSYTFNNVTANHTISVEFELIPYTITATVVGEGGTIDPIGEVIVDCGTNKTFNFTPAACNQIKEVKVDGVVIPTANSYTFNNVTEDHTISVEFELIPYTITATVVGEGGTIDPIGEVIVDCGTNKTFNFTPAACNQIKEVKVDGVVIPTANSYTFNNVTANHTISVEFELIPYTITATVVGEGGTIDPIGEVVVNCGIDTTITMTPDECYQISQVLVDGEDVTEEVAIDDDGIGSYTFASVTDDHTISVAFELIPYEIIGSVKNNEGGSITPMDSIADCGSDILFTMTPDACYRIKKVWDVYEEKDISNDITALATGAGYYLLKNITADHKIEVTFEKISYTITGVVEGEGGSIDPEELVIDCGENYEVSIDADECYQVLKVTDNGVDVTAQLFQGQIYNLEDITADHEIIATFEKIPYEIIGTVWDNEGGSITPMDTIANCGDSIVFTMTPDECSRIIQVVDVYEEEDITGYVTIDPTTGVGSYTLHNITDEHNIRVVFEPIYYTITATTDGNGTIDPDGAAFVYCGDSKEFCFEATHNYEIEKVTVNGVDIYGYAGDTSGCYTFTDVIADGTIHVTFKEIKPEPVLYGCPSDDLGMEGVGNGWINVGKSIPLRVEAKGGIIIDSVLWHSTNPNTAVVNPVSGLTTTASAVGPGATHVIATVQTNRGEFTLICYFEVIQPVTGIVVTPTQVSMYQYSTRQLVASVLPENASIKTVVWESSDETIATVNQQGLVTAVGIGTATITVTNTGTMYSDKIFTASCAVTVTKTLPTGVTMTPRTLTIDKGETFQLTATVAPVGANDNFTWTSSNANIVSVDATGVITANAAGSATITVRTVNNFYATCNVKVVVPVESITVTAQGSTTLPFSGSVRLSATVLPDDATDKSVKWISSNTAVATVSTTGVVTAKRVNGTVTITARNEASGIEGTIEIIVGTGGTPAPPAPAPIASEEGENITLFPNPTNGELTIRNEEAKMNSVRLFDLSGRMVIEKNNVNSNEASIDMTGLVEGIYFINVDGKTMKVVKK